mgnify:CR=1 FL=1
MRQNASPPSMLPETTDRHALLRAAAALLPGDTARLDAELLLAAALGEERLPMLLGRTPVTAAARAAFAALLGRRIGHEPVAYILGVREFWSLPIRVTRDVLVPRPESETLLEAALDHFAGRKPDSVLDLGTGSGALLLAALTEWPAAAGLGIDRSAAALRVAAANAERLGLGSRASFRLGDWLQGVAGRFDLVLCNPPYVPDGTELMPEVAGHEPEGALFGGPDGLAPYRRLLPGLAAVLRPGGVALFEFGAGQQQELSALAAAHGLAGDIVADLAGRPRVLRLPALV